MNTDEHSINIKKETSRNTKPSFSQSQGIRIVPKINRNFERRVEQVQYPTIIQKPAAEKFKRRSYRKLILMIAVLLLIIAGGAISSVRWYKNRNPIVVPNKTIEEVSKLVTLPADETPVIATVVDLEKLKGQPFFENALIGDKVLIFSKAKKVILYRPSENKIIDVAPLNTQ